jgi:DNA-directed RNA polymerase specialized sigma subunit
VVKRRQRQYPGLSREQQKLVEDHMWIAGRLAYGAKCLTGGHTGSLTREDLESIAKFALCVAATKYNPELNVKYSTYAWKTARGYIQHALRDYSRLVKTPRWIAQYKDQVFDMLKENRTYGEIAEVLKMDESRVLDCQLSENNYHVSYDLQPDEWGSTEFVYNPDDLKSTLLSKELIEELNKLTDTQIDLVVSFTEGRELNENDNKWASEVFEKLHGIAHGL